MKIEDIKKELEASGGKIYQVDIEIQEDDDNTIEKVYFFKKPGTASYDRYLKTSSASNSKALKTFAEDNVCDQQTEELHKDFEEYPALSITIGEKLLSMLGLGKTTTVKKL
ncbi:MAG: hypothetical protein RR466_11390 [Hungatella sp.]